MRLKDITIRNFRGIESLELPLDRLTVLITIRASVLNS